MYNNGNNNKYNELWSIFSLLWVNYTIPFGFSFFRHFLGITFQLFELLCLAKDHWWGLSTWNAHMVHIVKELGSFHIIFALTLTAHNICLTHITPSILISASALGYILSIKVEFVMRNMMSICLFCCIWKGGLKNTTSRNLNRPIKLLIFNVISCEPAHI